MTLDQVIAHYDNDATAACYFTGFTRQSLYLWKKAGRIPYAAQCVIQVKTNGALLAEDGDAK